MVQGRRGAPRSESARIAVLDATAKLFAERGWDQLTIEGIAFAAGVGKQTIYRWWPSKASIVAECLLEGRILPGSFIPQDTGDLRADVDRWVDEIVAYAATEQGAAIFRSLIAAAADHEDVGIRLREALGTDAGLIARLEAAVRAGQIHDAHRAVLLGEALIGMLVVRLITRTPIERDVVRHYVDAIVTA